MSTRDYLGLAIAISSLCGACGGSHDDAGEATESDPQAFMAHYFEVFDAKATEDILALYSPDVSAKISGLGTLEGRDAVRDGWLLPFTTAFPDYEHSVKSLTPDQSRVVADFVFTGTHQAPLLGFEPTGKELVLPITGTYEVVDGAVIEFELIYDLATVLSAIQP